MSSLLRPFSRRHTREPSIDFAPMGRAAGPLLQAVAASQEALPGSATKDTLGPLPEDSLPAEYHVKTTGSAWARPKHRPTESWYQIPVGFGGPPKLELASGAQHAAASQSAATPPQPSLNSSRSPLAVRQADAAPAEQLQLPDAAPGGQGGTEAVMWHANPAASPKLVQQTPAGTTQGGEDAAASRQPLQPLKPPSASKLPLPPRHLRSLANSRSSMATSPHTAGTAQEDAGAPQTRSSPARAAELPAAHPTSCSLFKFMSNLSESEGEGTVGTLQQQGTQGQRQRQEAQQPAQAVAAHVGHVAGSTPLAASARSRAPPSQQKAATPPPPPPPLQPSLPSREPGLAVHQAPSPPPAAPPPPPRAAPHPAPTPAAVASQGQAWHAPPASPLPPPAPASRTARGNEPSPPPAATPPSAGGVGAACSGLGAIKPAELQAAAARLRPAAAAQDSVPHPAAGAGSTVAQGALSEQAAGTRDQLMNAIRNCEFKLRKVDAGAAPPGKGHANLDATIGRSQPAMAELMRKVQERRAVVDGGSDSEGEWD